MKTLIIVESPSKAKSLEKYLDKNYIIIASKGHITELAKGGHHGIGVDIKNNFTPKYVLMKEKVSLLNEIIALANKCDQVLIASDPDREGEAIAWHLSQRLEGINKPIKRARFHEIKKEAIKKSIANPESINMNIVHAQEGRRILDRIVGFTISPYLMNYYGNNISAGRVQSVATRMIVDRELEIESFVPENYWTIQCSLVDKDKNNFVMKYANKISDQKTADDLYSRMINKKYVVKSVEESDEKKNPSAPLITSTLQQIMSKTYKFSADRTMKAAQSLYEAGFCTYLRTDSIRCSDEALKELLDYIKLNNLDAPKKPFIYKNGDAAQDAHECIRPVDINNHPDDAYLSDPDEELVYETIWRYFVASQMSPIVYSALRVEATPEDEPEIVVKAMGKTLKSKGFLDILKIKDKSKMDIPYLKVNDVISLSGKNPILAEKKQTKPPSRYSEADLIKELDDKKIGRPSTYAELLTKITSRGYVEKDENIFHATELGKKITKELIDNFSFMNYDYTAMMETKLDDIGDGKITHLKMLNDFYPDFKKELDKAYKQKKCKECERCNSAMVDRVSKAGNPFYACTNPSCKFITN